MATAPQNDVLLLGAGGKLGRMVRAAWPAVSDRRLVPVTRGAGDGALRWVPGTPHDDLPRVGAVVALWGVTGRAPHALAMNSHLAEQAQNLALALGATRVIHCSSAAVYVPADTPVSEVTDPAPPTPYGQAKLAMERRLAELSDAELATLRYTQLAARCRWLTTHETFVNFVTVVIVAAGVQVGVQTDRGLMKDPSAVAVLGADTVTDTLVAGDSAGMLHLGHEP